MIQRFNFGHHVFNTQIHSNVSLNYFIIFVTFPHCVFLNVSPNCLPERLQSYTGCICKAFLHCVFADEFSNFLSRIVTLIVIFWLLSSVCFHMFPQIARLSGFKATLAALVWPSFCHSNISFYMVGIIIFKIVNKEKREEKGKVWTLYLSTPDISFILPFPNSY